MTTLIVERTVNNFFILIYFSIVCLLCSLRYMSATIRILIWICAMTMKDVCCFYINYWIMLKRIDKFGLVIKISLRFFCIVWVDDMHILSFLHVYNDKTAKPLRLSFKFSSKCIHAYLFSYDIALALLKYLMNSYHLKAVVLHFCLNVAHDDW